MDAASSKLNSRIALVLFLLLWQNTAGWVIHKEESLFLEEAEESSSLA